MAPNPTPTEKTLPDPTRCGREATRLHATWLHPACEPDAIRPGDDDNPLWSWALSVTTPRTEEARQAAGWICGVHGENVELVNFDYGVFALYRLRHESGPAVAARVPNEPAEALLRRLGQRYGSGGVRLCGVYVLITTESAL